MWKRQEFKYDQLGYVELVKTGSLSIDIVKSALLDFIVGAGMSSSQDIEFHIHFKDGRLEKFSTLNTRVKKLKKLCATINDQISDSKTN